MSAPVEESVDQTKPNFYLIQLDGPLLEQWRQQLEKLDVKVLEYVPYNNYTAKLDPSQVFSVQNLPFVKSVKIYGPQDTGPITLTLDATLPSAGPSPFKSTLEMVTYDIRLHRKEDLNQVINWLKDQNINIGQSSGRKIRIYLLSDSVLPDQISQFPKLLI